MELVVIATRFATKIRHYILAIIGAPWIAKLEGSTVISTTSCNTGGVFGRDVCGNDWWRVLVSPNSENLHITTPAVTPGFTIHKAMAIRFADIRIWLLFRSARPQDYWRRTIPQDNNNISRLH